MRVPVVVLIGAGASYASGLYSKQFRPPLTRDLFRGPHAEALLAIYTRAQTAGHAIEDEMRANSTLAFEQALLGLRTNGHAHGQLMSRALRPYLQALLLTYSQRLHADARRYSSLVLELLKLPTHVHFVSLNYDTLLDNRLAALIPLRSIDDYIDTPLDCSLIKPHGSANWYWEVENEFDPKAPPLELSLPAGPITAVPADAFELHVVRGVDRGAPHDVTRRYPAIALPEGPKDELMLPATHLEFFCSSIGSAHELDVLVLGYSALDTEVLDLITASRARVRRLTVVNRSGRAALGVLAEIRRAGIKPVWEDVCADSFERWIDDGALREWVDEFGGVQGGPYPSLLAPEELERQLENAEWARRVARRRTEPNPLRLRW